MRVYVICVCQRINVSFSEFVSVEFRAQTTTSCPLCPHPLNQPWQCSHDAPGFLPLWLSLCAISGSSTSPSEAEGPALMEAIDGQRKAPLWHQGQAWAPVCSHTASLRHTLAWPLRTECQQRRLKDRSGKVPHYWGNGMCNGKTW